MAIIVTIDATRHGARYRGRMKLGRLLMRHAVDALVLVLAVLGQLEVWAASISGQTLVLALAGLVGTLPLLVRRRFPFGAPALVFAALAGMALVNPSSLGEGSNLQLVAVVSLMLALWFAGALNRGEQVLAAVAIGLASTAVVGRSAREEFAVVGDDSDLGVLGVFLIGGALALAAFALQRRTRRTSTLEDRAARLEREHEERARAAVMAERTRIARDLHDVIAHSVAVMTVQAGAARLLLPQEPERARDAALSVEETGRQALGEMRRLLGILRTEEGEPARAPQPGLGDLKALLEQMQRAGLPVALEVEGRPGDLPPGMDLAAYRIAEEALAYALEHAHASRARVTVRYERETLDLEISNDGRGAFNHDGRGDGLVAVRELVALYRGELEAGAPAGGDYAVRARLPLSPTRSRSVSPTPTAGGER
jgi:signal transduction histidine kinase